MLVAIELGDELEQATLRASGEIGFSKVRELTRVATPENAELLVTVARFGTAHHVERLVGGYRRA